MHAKKAAKQHRHLRPQYELFLVAFSALFLELMLIRWAPAAVRLVAYYANLMLISSFLGLGLGALTSYRKLNLFRFFSLLLTIEISCFAAARFVTLPGSSAEHRFFADYSGYIGYVVLVGLFAINTILFVPLGERIGELFDKVPPLEAYKWDLGGSLCGTLCFGVFSFLAFSPVLGILIVAVLYLFVSRRNRQWGHITLLGASAVLVWMILPQNAIWSPYNYLTIYRFGDAYQTPLSQPPPNLRTMANPPFFFVKVNQHFYQLHGSINLDRYIPGTPQHESIKTFRAKFLLPFNLKPNAQSVAIVGSGGGVDVEAALLSDVKQITAVEIDPKLIELAGEFNAAPVYASERVRIEVDDARAFFSRATPGFDIIIFGFLDSQSLFSSMANVRLDGFVYTVESLRTAYELLSDDGLLSLAFVDNEQWLIDKLYGMVTEAVGREPAMYETTDGSCILTLSKNEHTIFPDRYSKWKRTDYSYRGTELATDDWPYLYLSRRTIPIDYLIAIASMLAISLVAIYISDPNATKFKELHFVFLGMGFLLMETNLIVRCSLYFGSTWLVSMLVIAGVLLMVMLANFVATRFKESRKTYYIPLFLVLGILFAVPSDLILGLSLWGRAAWTMFAVPLPIFFAGLIFSTSLRDSANPSASFGSNLIGATFGGFLEYLGMVTGHQLLFLIVISAYLGSLLTLRTRVRH